MEGDLILENLSEDGELAKRFLLDDVSEPERTQVEDRLLADNDFYQELLITEDDLIDAYARGRMPAAERTLFEPRYLNSRQGRARIEFAKRLYDSVSSKADTPAPAPKLDQSVSWWRALLGGPVGSRRALGFAMAAVALLVVMIAGIWFLRERARTRPAPLQAQTGRLESVSPRQSPSPQIAEAEEPPSTQRKETSQTPARETTKRATPVIAAFTLLPGTVRGETGTQLNLPTGATQIVLRLGIEGEPSQKYRATLSTPEGKKLWSGIVAAVKPSNNSSRLTVSFPANLLKGSDYVMAVSGVNAEGKWESVADYSFRVARK
jgi:hypothetical protein